MRKIWRSLERRVGRRNMPFLLATSALVAAIFLLLVLAPGAWHERGTEIPRMAESG